MEVAANNVPLTEKVTAILDQLPENTSPEIQVLVKLVHLLLDENKNDFKKLQDIVEVQKTVSERLVDENSRLKKQNESLHRRLIDIEYQVDENEQHDRNINLVIKGVPESNNEDTTKKFVDALNEHYEGGNRLKTSDIKRSHRLGKRIPNAAKPRPIIARFARETKKMDTFRNKSKLKGKGVSLSENLTKYRADVYRKACDKLNYKNVWSWEGRIFAMVDGRKLSIKCYKEH